MNASQRAGASYIERAQAVASEHPAFQSASFRQQTDVLDLIREHGSDLESGGLSAEQAADAVLVQVLPLPWCERCRSYHHESAQHIVMRPA
jgi:hypothetical protein